MTTRPLTAGEITLARSVFADAIDYRRVQIHDQRFLPGHPDGMGMAPNGQIYFPGCCSPDFSQESLDRRAFFIHEMTHVWQYQNKILHPVVEFARLNLQHGFNYAAAYHYSLEPGKELTAYGMEQQARIVEDYFYKRAQGGDTSAFAGVLGRFLQNPSYARRESFPLSLPRWFR